VVGAGSGNGAKRVANAIDGGQAVDNLLDSVDIRPLTDRYDV
jgi:hypothetical protein